ncbi:MAG: shikimate kinase, partial [Halobacteriota archaeon]
MEGRAFAPGGISVVNAIVTGRGATAAIDLGVTATVELDPETSSVEGMASDRPAIDPTLVETCL